MSGEIKVCYIVDLNDGAIFMSDMTEEAVKQMAGTEDFIVVDIKNNKEWNPVTNVWETIKVRNLMEEKEESDLDPDDDMSRNQE